VGNGDFETGSLSGWTTFTTANGPSSGDLGAGLPAVTSFDTTGAGASNAAQFDVGHLAGDAGVDPEGGGLVQTATTDAGPYMLSADIAANNPAANENGSCSMFELLLDGAVVASHDFGPCPGSATQRFHLSSGGLMIAAGAHEVRVRVTRPYTEGP